MLLIYKIRKLTTYNKEDINIGNYKIIGKTPTGKKESYIVVYCNVCLNKSKSKYKNRVFLITKHHLLKGNKPCDCITKNKQRYLFQIRDLITDHAKSLDNITVTDIYSTKIMITNIKSVFVKFVYQGKTLTSNARSFLRRLPKTNLKLVPKEKVGKRIHVSDDVHIQDFMNTGAYPEGTLFWRSPRKDSNSWSYWYYQCPICKKDPELFGDAIYEASISFFKKGNNLCGCRRTPKWTQEQYKIKIDRICKEKDLVFNGYLHNEGETKACAKTYLSLTCSAGHTWNTTNIDSFINRGTSCPICGSLTEGGIGYYTLKKDCTDSLYLLGFNNFFKIGRTFNLKERFVKIRSVSNYDFTILGIYEGKHSSIFEIEQTILSTYRPNRYPVDWTKETLQMSVLSDCITLLNNSKNIVKVG